MKNGNTTLRQNTEREINGILSLFNRTESTGSIGAKAIDKLLEASEKMIDYMDIMGPGNGGGTPLCAA